MVRYSQIVVASIHFDISDALKNSPHFFRKEINFGLLSTTFLKNHT
jgi:hypothetical protein